MTDTSLLQHVNNIETVTNCTGCAACANICPYNAIEIKQDKNGFHRPFIIEDRCVQCGKCKQVCPLLNSKETNRQNTHVYAVWANNEIRAKSSSGGAFSILANWIFEHNGYVAGAAFDKDWNVQHIIINNKSELDKLRGSKYVQSRISETLYKDIQSLLEHDKYVLFSGTPCQVAGLKYYLKKDYEKLLLVDILCTYAPSPKVWKKYLEYIVPDNNTIQSINFRDKKIFGWKCSSLNIKTDKSQISDNKYMRAFLSMNIMDPACENCKFAQLSRESDITIADFWGIEKYKKDWNDNKGTSIFMPNNAKGDKIWEILKNKFKRIEKIPVKYAMQRVLDKPFEANINRDNFMQQVNFENFHGAYEKYLGTGRNIGILNFWYIANRGAILTNYALNEFLKENNYNPLTIKYYHRTDIEPRKNNISTKFEKKYLQTTEYCKDYLALKNLNSRIKTFLVGSDQVFRDWCVNHHKQRYFLNFADENSKKIAVAASFGTNQYEGSEYSKTIMQKYLKRFDYLSVREHSGCDILKNTFKLDSIQIQDPVFYINKTKYEKIAETSKKREHNFLAYYIITMTPEKQKLLEFTANKLNLKLVDIKRKLPVEDWLYYIKNCDFYIGDSFHGTCFALIFHKNFYSLSAIQDKFDPRIYDILKLANLEDRMLIDYNEIYTTKKYLINEKINYESKLETLNSEIEKSKQWLLHVIEAPKENKEYSEEENLFFAIMDKINEETDTNKRNIILLNNKYKISYNYYRYGLLKFLIPWKKEHYQQKYRTYSRQRKLLKSLKY